jgi:hypothetical protein
VYLTLRSLTVVSPTEVDTVFADDAGAEVSFRFTGDLTGDVLAVSGEPAFSDRYRRVPGPSLPLWPERLAAAALRAAREPLPAGETLDGLIEHAGEELRERWRQTGQGRP